MGDAPPSSAWDRFWQYDRLSSFETGPGASNYGTHVADGWIAFFRASPADATVVDLCTGNGAIAVLAAETLPGATVIGVDAAAIEPSLYCSTGGEAIDRITFRGRVMAEELPLPDASTDIVASQFGIEYSDMSRSLPEAMRVLRPGGRLRLAMHAAEGAVVRDTRRALEDAYLLLADGGLIGAARTSYDSLVRYEQGERDLGTRAEADYRAFRTALADAEAHERTAMDTAMLRSVRADVIGLFNRRKTEAAADAIGRLDRLETEIRDHRDRQQALLRAARSRSEVEEDAALLAAAGFSVTICAQEKDRETIAHVLEARAQGSAT